MWGICYLRISKQEMQNFYLNWLQASGHAARCTTLVLKEDIYFGSSRKDAVLMCPTRFSQWPIKFLTITFADTVTSLLWDSWPSLDRDLAVKPRPPPHPPHPPPIPPQARAPQVYHKMFRTGWQSKRFSPEKNFWIGNRTTWTKLLFPGGPCPHWPPGSVGRCRLHREVSHFFSA